MSKKRKSRRKTAATARDPFWRARRALGARRLPGARDYDRGREKARERAAEREPEREDP